mgnify:CR=1 FL=1
MMLEYHAASRNSVKGIEDDNNCCTHELQVTKFSDYSAQCPPTDVGASEQNLRPVIMRFGV